MLSNASHAVFRLLLSLLVAAVGVLQARDALSVIATVGGEFQVNSDETGDQTTKNPQSGAVGMASDGEFVVVFQSYEPPPTNGEIYARRYDSAGVAYGTQFAVAFTSTYNDLSPAVAMADDKSYMVVWLDATTDDVIGRTFDSSGTPTTIEFFVNSYLTGIQFNASVAPIGAGNWVVVWDSATGQDGSGSGVFGQRFNAVGTRIGTEFQINSYTTGTQYYSEVAGNEDGSFVVVWADGSNRDGDDYSVVAKRFDPTGSPVGTEFIVNTYTTGHQGIAHVSTSPSGSFVVAWTSLDQDESYGGIFGQRFDPSGAPVGTEFAVNSYTTDEQTGPRITVQDDESFIVAWTSWAQDGSMNGQFARTFLSSATPDGDDFQVNTYTTNRQEYAAIASDGSGGFVMAWSSPQDQDGYGVFAQRGVALISDVDADGVPDGLDPCTNIGGAQNITIKSKTQFKKVNTDPTPGNDGLKVQGEFISASAFSQIDPVTDGARLVVAAADGTTRLDVSIPGGAGWAVNSSGTKYQFKDKTGANSGIVKVKIQDRSNKAPNQVKIQFQGKNGTYAIVTGDDPVRATAVIGDGSVGECGDTTYVPGDCGFSGSGNSLRCRQ